MPRRIPGLVVASLALLATSSLEVQVPLLSSEPTPAIRGPLIEVGAGQWNLSVGPEPDSTSHLVFDTVASLLQRWPNTRYRNGHNVVPGIIPVGTLIYHGRETQEIPNGPEWVAMDPELSRGFCVGFGESGCWHLTFVSTRPLKVLYFDGSSGAKMAGGSLDTQDYVAWNKSHPEWVLNERKRIADLCHWGKKYNLDGLFRYVHLFFSEIMVCDFTSGVQLVSSIQLNPESEPWFRSGDIPPTPTRGYVPPQSSLWLEYKMVEAGTWYHFYPGEGRVKLDLTRLISFYDTDMFPSLIPLRSGLDRLQHRVAGISDRDVQQFHQRLDEVLQDYHSSESSSFTSGSVDWRTLYQVTRDRYADRLQILQYILSATDPTAENYSKNHTQTASNAMYRLQLMLTTYALQTARPPTLDTGVDKDLSWASPVYQYCATTHTSALYPFKASFTKSEHLLLSALEGTNREICRVIVRLWAEGIEAGVDPGLPLWPIGRGDGNVTDEYWLPMLKHWKNDVEGLMSWLEWSIWLKCRPTCDMEEICYMPTWPWFKNTPWPTFDSAPRAKGSLAPGLGDPDEEEWRNPLPRCIRRMEPFDWRNP
ncbi:hypothetical protein BDN72DRAFT_768155 [Pluteus cervinus]|uniref:Uncharacterized protein n=1 Tax=Pluteus cervinus TaxID=181527 RepID=A0ACD3ATZ7_9AGAR|nr:hypothetical protein BDN72DRAFT_768155 [Pluteus cervinus]